MIVGHEKLINHFIDLAKNGGLSQAYCFVGPNQLGKRSIANFVASKLLGVNEDKVISHPDYFLVTRAADEKTGVLKTEISVAQARVVRSALREKPWGSGHRVVVVDEAETLSIEAANALLKIVEEPPERTTLFFLVDRIENIPATIKSRTEVFYFSLVPDKHVVEWLVGNGVSEVRAKEIAPLAWGRPGRAKLLAEDTVFFEREAELTRVFNMLLNASVAERASVIEKITEKKEGERVAEEVRGVLDTWIMAGRAQLLERVTTTKLKNIIDNLHVSKELLKQNVNPRLILENIFFTH